MIKDITIIIPTHERHNVLLRSMDYFSRFNASILIVDSSLSPIGMNLSSEKIKYIHCPNLFFGDKIHFAIKNVKTPYTCLCADDDFLSENGLMKGLEFLKSHLDYSSVQGHYIQFMFIKSESILRPIYEKYIGLSIDSDLINQRIEISPEIAQVYALHRTDILERCLRTTIGLKEISLVEICISLVAVCYGKHTILPIFWSARDGVQHSTYIDNTSTDRFTGIKIQGIEKSENIVIGDWELYLNTSDGLQFKKNFIKVVSDIVFTPYYSDRLFNLFFIKLLEINRKKIEQFNGNNSRLIMRSRVIIKELIPSFLIREIRKITKQHMIIKSKKLCNKYKTFDGYPWSSSLAMKDWKKIKKVICNHIELLES
ncbi:TIGR00180 family glycosyltransferase [bacterium]|jgi:glycosyltransferase domain-containing protein|nr:TIGR00180 family glycosyltransferase [bacterium]